MNAFQAIVLGLVQGATEFLPISSTAHLRIVSAFFGWKDPGATFTAVTQLGTVAAVLIFFRRDIGRILTASFRGLRDPVARQSHDAKMGSYIAVGSVPILVFGFLFRHQIDSGARNLVLISLALIIFAGVMLYAEDTARKDRDLGSLGSRDGIAIGLAQALAVIPGVSRSGATISAGLMLGFDRVAAARYSFLLSIPAVLASGLYKLRSIGEPGAPGIAPTLVATLIAFVVGYASIAGLLKFLQTRSTRVFVAYRVVLGLLVLSLVAGSVISAT